mmetsp:Transcript_82852/g.208704  ORF Transcript_82852/g.208704 Transcript_82852/m.208704 type:complete len:579 (-) Transcript_82852:257-1993(-)|eukprot:CAMPEP_0115246516 /NCGR_PEP_ID=MMETSP0270-20121206/41068_1 /TAXON_ID=71861 /ORGANISM="Scrippsiella trochoidea, Strain CCMP3099" /LENGTH=578 /DNA_ID=CAMNT_0002661735 /DNA_START=57 /DNA_END=1793 /DNA_ORIENTATION=-
MADASLTSGSGNAISEVEGGRPDGFIGLLSAESQITHAASCGVKSVYSNVSAQRSVRRADTGAFIGPEIGKMFDISGCRSARLRHIMGIEGSGQTKEGNEEFAQEPELYRRATPLEPYIAVRRLLGHVHFDVDGGILNLTNDTLEFQEDLSEVTKVPMLKKNCCEITIAMVTILRLLMNAGCIMWEGKTALMHYMLGTELSEKMREASGWHSLHMPMMELFVTVKLFECVAVIGMLSIVLWDAVCIFLSSQHSTYYAMRAGKQDQKYHRLVRIWWEIYPELQNFSALRALEFVHPALIAQHFGQVMMARQEVARAILERFLRLKPDVATDEELLDSTAKVLVACNDSTPTKQEQYSLATEYLHSTPCAMAYEALNSSGLQQVAQGKTDNSFNVDVEALSLCWRLRFYTVMLFFKFVIMAVVCALAGWLSFVVKMCFVSHIISNPTTSVFQGLLPMVVFLNQMVGIVSLRRLLIARVRAFAFGGSDGMVSNEERYLLNVYLAILQAKIWSSTGLTNLQKLTVMVQLDDRDLQELLLEEDPLVKSDVVLSVKQHMLESGIVSSGPLLSWVRGAAPIEKNA